MICMSILNKQSRYLAVNPGTTFHARNLPDFGCPDFGQPNQLQQILFSLFLVSPNTETKAALITVHKTKRTLYEHQR